MGVWVCVACGLHPAGSSRVSGTKGRCHIAMYVGERSTYIPSNALLAARGTYNLPKRQKSSKGLRCPHSTEWCPMTRFPGPVNKGVGSSRGALCLVHCSVRLFIQVLPRYVVLGLTDLQHQHQLQLQLHRNLRRMCRFFSAARRLSLSPVVYLLLTSVRPTAEW